MNSHIPFLQNRGSEKFSEQNNPAALLAVDSSGNPSNLLFDPQPTAPEGRFAGKPASRP